MESTGCRLYCVTFFNKLRVIPVDEIILCSLNKICIIQFHSFFLGITREKFIEIKAGQSTNSLTNKRNKSSQTLDYRQNSTDITTEAQKHSKSQPTTSCDQHQLKQSFICSTHQKLKQNPLFSSIIFICIQQAYQKIIVYSRIQKFKNKNSSIVAQICMLLLQVQLKYSFKFVCSWCSGAFQAPLLIIERQ